MLSRMECIRGGGLALAAAPVGPAQFRGGAQPQRAGFSGAQPRPAAPLMVPSLCRRAVSCAATTKEKADEAHDKQVQKTALVVKLIEADNIREVAHDNADEFDEHFFSLANAYLEMAKSEQKGADMIHRIKVVIKVAMEEKSATLRPEIRLLNDLLACKNREQRRKILKKPETRETLEMNDRYFWNTLLKRMIADVSKQEVTSQQRALMSALKHIDQETHLILE